jgi:hypothetical protein
MRKIYLSIIGFSIICRLNAYSQEKPDTSITKTAVSLYKPIGGQDSTSYRPKRLRLDEVDLISSYYTQTGDHSAITGGNGTQNVTDISNGIDLHFVWLGQNNNKNTLAAGLGIDHHTSASSGYINLAGTGKQGGSRIYPSLDWTVENAKTGNTFGLGAYYSGEYNYKSKGADLHFSIKTADKNGEFGVKLQGYFDKVTLIYPSELVTALTPAPTGAVYITSASGNPVLVSAGSVSDGHGSKVGLQTSPRNTYTASLSYSQIINSRLQVIFLADGVAQNGYLGLPYHRVYFSGRDTAVVEKLPSSRFKIPLGVRLNYFLGDDIILRSYYRYYHDNWGINSNTANLEVAYKVSPFFSISPFYRYYNQSASKYFAPYGAHSPDDQYYTSNYEYAKFESSFYGVGLRLAPPNGVFGWQNLHEVELRYGHYSQTIGLVSDVISLSLGFK